MSKTIPIKTIPLEKLSIGEYAQFLEGVIALVEQATEEKLHLDSALLPSLKEKMSQLTEVMGQSSISQETRKLVQLDKERSKAVSFLISSFRLERNHLDKARSEAATDLYEVSKNYTGIQSMPIRTKTQYISALLNDLEKPTNKQHIQTLGLTKFVQVLTQTNEEYKELSRGRALSQMTNTLPSFRKIKRETNTLYRELVQFSQGVNLLLRSDESVNFAHLLNKLITDTVTANKQRIATTVPPKADA